MFAAGNGSIIFTGGGFALHSEYGVGVSALSVGESALCPWRRVARRALGGSYPRELVTIAATVVADTPFDPDRIAEYYWNLRMQPRSEWATEVVFDGID